MKKLLIIMLLLSIPTFCFAETHSEWLENHVKELKKVEVIDRGDICKDVSVLININFKNLKAQWLHGEDSTIQQIIVELQADLLHYRVFCLQKYLKEYTGSISELDYLNRHVVDRKLLK